ncbi:hypothetical protein ACIBJF_42105 [Streptomyces sp. NPDC050743]
MTLPELLAPLVATVQARISHFVAEEQPEIVIRELTAFFRQG